MPSQLKYHDYFQKKVIYSLLLRLPIKNIMELPYLKKIVLNIGFLHEGFTKEQFIPGALLLERLSGKTAKFTKSKKQNYRYKIRKGMVVGVCCTLRNKPMLSFIEKLIEASYSLNKHLINITYILDSDKHYITFSVKDYTIFPHIEPYSLFFKHTKSFEITLVFNQSSIFKKYPNLLKIVLNSLGISLNTALRK